MGWQVAYRKRDNTYRLWSTISDDWLTDWSTKQDIQKYIAEDMLLDHKKQIIKMCLGFPNLWPAKGSLSYIKDEAGHDRYGDWLKVLNEATEETYIELVETKYNEVIGELDATVR